MKLSELRIIKILFSYKRFTQFTGMTIDMILKASDEETKAFNFKQGNESMKPLSIWTIKKNVLNLVSTGYVSEGIKKDSRFKTYYLTEKGLDVINDMSNASEQLKKLQNAKEEKGDE